MMNRIDSDPWIGMGNIMVNFHLKTTAEIVGFWDVSVFLRGNDWGIVIGNKEFEGKKRDSCGNVAEGKKIMIVKN